MKLIKRVYAILFVAGQEGVSREQLANSLQVPMKEIDEALQQLKLNFDNDDETPIELVNFNQHFLLVTKKDFAKDVEVYAQSPYKNTLTRAAIETLAIIAYRQPITRLAVDEIRGVSSANMIQKLIGRDLVKEVGRVEAPGRPVLYGITNYFMDYFGLESLEDLPEVEPLALNSESAVEDLFSTKNWQIELFDELEQ
ncbi:SMC-Scp complex subunit ScpB [Aerococcaceae bacterium WS4759]|uniref:Segregation and condensation protein B n=1 Tax=Fundicoccus ignavus TaxID=2664442 RepID=A0A6I2GHS7_9LACT|nr:SMC-Scp complex subunit ScpB [Fundicoccus ignavus]MRI84829.1 SMC-Scp complex subunit ScpB [Fundicoccus ignavus]